MRKCIKLNVNSFMYILLDSACFTVIDYVKDDKYNVGDFVQLNYISDCPDCKDKKEIMPLGTYKILDIKKCNFSCLQVDEENYNVIKEDIHIRMKDLKDDEEILCLTLKNGLMYGTDN